MAEHKRSNLRDRISEYSNTMLELGSNSKRIGSTSERTLRELSTSQSRPTQISRLSTALQEVSNNRQKHYGTHEMEMSLLDHAQTPYWDRQFCTSKDTTKKLTLPSRQKSKHESVDLDCKVRRFEPPSHVSGRHKLPLRNGVPNKIWIVQTSTA